MGLGQGFGKGAQYHQYCLTYWTQWSIHRDDLLIHNESLNNGATPISDDLVLGVFLLSWNIHWSIVSQDAAPRCRDGGPAQSTWGTCGQAQGQTGGGEVLRSLRFCWTESPPKSPFLSGSTLKSALGHFLEGSRSSRAYLPEIGQLSEKFSTFASVMCDHHVTNVQVRDDASLGTPGSK